MVATLIVIVFLFSPIYSLTFFIIFIPEYFFFFAFILNAIKYKRDSSYNSISVTCKKGIISNSVMSLWISISKINAFKRFYFLIKRSKISGRSVLYASTIYTLSIPVRLLKVLYYLTIYRKLAFIPYLQSVFYDLSSLMGDKRVEFINNKIYVNGKSLMDILQHLVFSENIFSTCKIEPKLASNLLRNIKRTNMLFAKHYLKVIGNGRGWESLSITYDLKSALITSKGELILKPHYAIEEKGNIIHATSTKPNVLTEEQRVDVAMPDAILDEAREPATVVTKLGNVEWMLSKKGILIPKMQVDFIKNNHPDLFDLGAENKKIIDQHALEIQEHFREAIGYKKLKNPEKVKQLIKEVTIGTYDKILFSSDNKEFIEIANEFYNG